MVPISFTRRGLLASLLKASAVATVSSSFATAQSAMASSTLVEDLVAANRILAQQGILDGYGHVSVRQDAAAGRYLLSRSLAPALATAADIRAQPRARAHPLRRGRCRAPPAVPHERLRGEGVPVFEIREARGNHPKMLMLVHNPALGRALAETLGAKPAALMRGRGAVIVGSSLPHVVGRSVYLALNATLQAQAAALGGSVNYLDPQEAQEEIPDNYQRAWDLWKRQAMAADCAAPRT